MALPRQEGGTKKKPPGKSSATPSAGLDRQRRQDAEKNPPKAGKVNWKSILLGSTGVHVSGAYHSQGRPGLRGGWHTGADIRASSGTGIRAPMAGQVTERGSSGSWGNYVIVKLDDTGDYMVVAHLSSIGVRDGQKIRVGQHLGKVGSTGNSTGPHLHLEIRRAATGGSWARQDSYFYDPVAYFNKHASSQTASDRGTPSATIATENEAINTGDGGTTTTTVSGPSGGGGLGKVAFSKKDFYAQFEAMYGDYATLLQLEKGALLENGGKTIEWAINQAVKQKLVGQIGADRLRSLLNQTAWFKKYSPDITKRLVEEKSKPGVFGAEVQKTTDSLRAAAAAKGVTLPEDVLAQISRNAYVYGWDQATIMDKVQESANQPGATFSGGEIGEQMEGVEGQAYLYGVELTAADQAQLRNDILDGKGNQALLDQIQERSAQKYTVFADQIRAGNNLRSLAGNYFTEAGNLLELDPNAIEMTDPLFTAGDAFQAVNPKTGQIEMRTLADFRKMVKKDARWLETVNAKKEAADVSGSILKTMGLI